MGKALLFTLPLLENIHLLQKNYRYSSLYLLFLSPARSQRSSFYNLHFENLMGFLEAKLRKCGAPLKLAAPGVSGSPVSSHSAPTGASNYDFAFPTLYGSNSICSKQAALICDSMSTFLSEFPDADMSCNLTSLVGPRKITDFHCVRYFLSFFLFPYKERATISSSLHAGTKARILILPKFWYHFQFIPFSYVSEVNKLLSLLSSSWIFKCDTHVLICNQK